MKNKNFISTRILLILGTCIVGLVTLAPPNQLVWASIAGSNNASNSNQQEGAGGCNPITDPRCKTENPSSSASNSNQLEGAGGCNPYDCQEAVNHINEAQSALKNGDTEGAQKHLDLAKQSLGTCDPPYTRGC